MCHIKNDVYINGGIPALCICNSPTASEKDLSRFVRLGFFALSVFGVHYVYLCIAPSSAELLGARRRLFVHSVSMGALGLEQLNYEAAASKIRSVQF